jgi:hypothetical protein
MLILVGLVGKLSLEELAVEASDVADAYALGALSLAGTGVAFFPFLYTFAINREDTHAHRNKYSSKLDISRSLICIFVA